MPIPSISSITPSSGTTAGSLLVEILGAGFQLAALPAGAATIPSSMVGVLVGGRAAREVRVFAGDRLTCIVPIGDAGPADVVVQNLDAAGVPIPGEQAVGRACGDPTLSLNLGRVLSIPSVRVVTEEVFSEARRQEPAP